MSTTVHDSTDSVDVHDPVYSARLPKALAEWVMSELGITTKSELVRAGFDALVDRVRGKAA